MSLVGGFKFKLGFTEGCKYQIGSQFLRDGDELTRFLEDPSRSGSYLGTLLFQLIGVRES